MTALLAVLPAEAHVFTKDDPNDSASKIDLRSVSVSHTSTSVIHKVRTWNSWTPASLQHDSFFVIGINKDGDPAYERCAFIYYTSRLRGQLSNCESLFIRFLPVSKVNATTAKITIPKNLLTPAYKWFARSLWVGAAPCGNGCNDVAPNALPDLLHDLTPPVITMSTDALEVWDTATTPDFVFPFSVNDVHTAVTWRVESRLLGETAWSTVSTGSGEGPKEPAFTSVPAGQYEYRIVAVDSQGNRTNSAVRLVYVPADVLEATGPGFSSGGVDVADLTAYGGGYVAFDDVTDKYDIEIDHPGGPCRAFTVIGPGSGTWIVQVTGVGIPTAQISGNSYPDEPRYPIYSELICEATDRQFVVTAGTGFGVDAVLI